MPLGDIVWGVVALAAGFGSFGYLFGFWSGLRARRPVGRHETPSNPSRGAGPQLTAANRVSGGSGSSTGGVEPTPLYSSARGGSIYYYPGDRR
jgi:hypothetical protein